MYQTFDGVLDCIDGDMAYVTLTSRANGNVFHGDYSAKRFTDKGIEEDDRFVLQTDGMTYIKIEVVPDSELTDADVKAIRDKIHKVLPINDPGVKY